MRTMGTTNYVITVLKKSPGKFNKLCQLQHKMLPHPTPAPADPFSGITIGVLSTVLGSLSVHLSSWSNFDRVSDAVGSSAVNFWGQEEDHFDFIVVGGGSAGGTVAARLSEQFSVLLLEAGGEMSDWQQIPAMSLLMLSYPEIDWNFKTVSQKKSCFALPRNKSHWSQGKGLGGTANLNFLIQSRGAPKDFDNWAEHLNDSSWSYESLLPYFKKTENYEGRWEDNGMHGKGGEITVKEPEYIGMAEIFVEAAQQMGYPRADLNGNFTEGFDVVFYPIKNGRRFGVYGAVINAVRTRPSLTIRKFSMVKKILIDNNNRAYGVEYERHGHEKRAYSNKEVIISAGVMNSPKLLLLSGVGPKDHLEKMEIPVKIDLPGVGQNLQDHMSTYLGPFFVNQPVTFSIERDIINSQSIAEYLVHGTGILTTTGTQAMGFYTTKYAKEANESDWPDIQTIMIGVSVGENFASDISRGFGLKHGLLTRYYRHAVGRDSFLQIVSLARPLARGYIKLKSNDPMVNPVINPNYFEDQRDVDVLVDGIKIAIQVVENTTAFNDIGGRFTDQVFPGCENVRFRSDEYWECYLRHLSITLHHIVGSCSMGTSENPYSVVDTQLKVYGIQYLRVIDSSVMPIVPIGNTNAPTIMIAEKGADMITRYWKP